MYGYVWNNPLQFTDPMGLDGWGTNVADWMEQNIDYAHKFYRSGDLQNWMWNGSVDTVRDLASGNADIFRVGRGIGAAMYCEGLPDYRRLELVADDMVRGGSLFLLFAAPGNRFAKSPTGVALNNRIVSAIPGPEFKIGSNFRIAPFGNRTGHPFGEKPHYHRRGPQIGPNQTADGQGIGRHRPWQKSVHDKSFWDRF